MIVKDLIDGCSEDEIITAVIALCDVDEEEREEIKQNYAAFINTLKKIKPVNTEYMLIGFSYLDDGKERLDVPLYKKSDIQNFEVVEIKDMENVEDLSAEEIDHLYSTLFIPEGYSFALSPWEEILGYEINKENVRDVGASKLAAAVIYEMTFFGFTNDEREAEHRKLREMVHEIKETEKDRKEWDWQSEDKNVDKMDLDLNSGVQENRRRFLRMLQKYTRE